MQLRLRPLSRVLLLTCSALLLAACGSQASEPFPSTQQNQVVEAVSLDPVGQNGRCIADLTTTRVILMTPPPRAKAGIVGKPTTAEEMRLGAVPSPPSAVELTSGPLSLRPGGAGTGGPTFGDTTFHVYQTPCFPSDVATFYTEVFRQNQWSGDFTPIGPLTQDNDYIGPKQQLDVSGNGLTPNLTLFDLQLLSTGLFTNVHPTGVTIAWISVVAAIVGPHTGPTTEHHPTYVQVMVQQRPAANPPPLAPPVSTTPNVGASGGPPGS